MDTKQYNILCLDGGGSKGFYTLGVLEEIEALLKEKPLHEAFDLIYGTSTGAIIASLIGLGYSITKIHELYKKYIPQIMKAKGRKNKSKALESLANEIYQDKRFDQFLVPLSIVTTNWLTRKPMIFKSNIGQTHGRQASFIPGFGATISDAVQASCSAFPIFEKKDILTSTGKITLIDGGFCANNPTLYALADVTKGLCIPSENIRLISVGTGNYTTKEPTGFLGAIKKSILTTTYPSFFFRTLDINTQSMEQLQSILFDHIKIIRINRTFNEIELATDLTEYDLDKLAKLRQMGRESFAHYELDIRSFFDMKGVISYGNS